MSSVTCSISEEVISGVNALRFIKTTITSKPFHAYVAKIDATQMVVEDQLDDVTDFPTLIDELPDNEPRYIVVSYRKEHEDGRVSYPLVFIYYCPETAPPQKLMLYASTQTSFANETKLGKSLLVEDKEKFSEEWEELFY
ncbi:hypothetical protein LPJ66_006631 [Kickxella alabastrina]|uniref:Uncharacterized protein n=1 Tax=Kickxella alabastrina TaxID=61397 RepID=A0ACC1IDK8_9FUNG|nr:hypothetical protein LPJ66_006631 [Kickxella alabastrina]